MLSKGLSSLFFFWFFSKLQIFCHHFKIDFIFGCAGVFVSGWAFPSCGAQVLGGRVLVVAACGHRSFGSQALEHGLCSCGAWA